MKSFDAKIRDGLLVLALASLGFTSAWGQDNSSSEQTSGAPPAATAPTEQNSENPPLSGLDAPSVEPVFGGRSYLVPGLQLSETVDSNASGSVNKSTVSEVSRGLGSIDLQKIWKRYQLGLDYIAGGVYYTGPRQSGKSRSYQMHTFAGAERILWRTGQLAIRDSLNYLPEGSFGFGSFGGAGSFSSVLGAGGAGTGLGGGLTGGTPGGLTGGGTFGTLGIQPRIDNSTVVDIAQGLSPRSSVTLAGAFNVTDFLDKSNAAFNIINSQQSTAQAGFNRLLTRHSQIGVLYAFQDFHFPRAGSGTVDAHVWNALYGHRITGRLNLVLGGGPQLVFVHQPSFSILGVTVPASTTKNVSFNGKVTLDYTLSSRTRIQVLYQRYVTPGSGFFAGANTDAARASLSRQLGRHWNSMMDLGYSRHTRLQTSASSAGVNSQTYQNWYAGASLRRQLGQHFGAFVNYQFNDLGLGRCAAGTGTVCSLSSQRHSGMIGIDWHPHPFRLD
jgi:hypothetical protein